MGWPPKKQLPLPWYEWDRQTPSKPLVWKEGDPPEPLSSRVSCLSPAQLFLKV